MEQNYFSNRVFRSFLNVSCKRNLIRLMLSRGCVDINTGLSILKYYHDYKIGRTQLNPLEAVNPQKTKSSYLST